MHGTEIRAAALPLFVAACFMLPPGLSAADAGVGEGLADYAPYLNLGLAAISPEGMRFTDGADSGGAALYGNENRFDDGTIAASPQALFAAGIRLRYATRLQLEYGQTRELEYSGNTNYRNSGTYQPSVAKLDTWQALLAAFRDFSEWEYASGRSIQPFLGIGAGIARYRLSGYVQRFPDPPDPNGPLRRGPAGEIPYTALSPGSDRNFTWMLTAGIAIPVRKSMELDLSYRYTDAGEIHTDPGDIKIVRFRESGHRREIPVGITQTRAELRTHSLTLTLRFEL